jgi:alkaline phosphatase
MPSANQPLFASERRSSVHSEERAAQEDDALLGNQRNALDTTGNIAGFFREVALFIWALIATTLVIVLALLLQHRSLQIRPRSPPESETSYSWYPMEWDLQVYPSLEAFDNTNTTYP